MDGEWKTIAVALGAVAALVVTLTIGITINARDEIAGKRERLELILRSGDCKSLAAELAK